jgi:hypothetical protein
VLPRQIISRSSKRPANYPLNFEGLKNGYESLRHRFGITRTGRIGRRSGCIKSRWRLSRNSLAGMIAIPRSHLLHKQFPVRSDRPFIVAAVLMQNTDKADLGWGCGMGHFHAEGDCKRIFWNNCHPIRAYPGDRPLRGVFAPQTFRPDGRPLQAAHEIAKLALTVAGYAGDTDNLTRRPADRELSHFRAVARSSEFVLSAITGFRRRGPAPELPPVARACGPAPRARLPWLYWFVTARTRFGLDMRAIGGNPEAARRLGIPVWATS